MEKKLNEFYEGIAALTALNALSAQIKDKLNKMEQKNTSEIYIKAPEGYVFENGKTEEKVIKEELPKFCCGSVRSERIDTSGNDCKSEVVKLTINLYSSGNTEEITEEHIISEVMRRCKEIE